MSIHLDGQNLSLDYVRKIAFEYKALSVSPQAWARVKQAADYIAGAVAEGRVMYGINTGFGAQADIQVDETQTQSLQHNLLISHACGVGDAFDEGVVRIALLLRINTLLQGHSGIQPETLKLMIDLLNRGIHPVVPSQGSVGASGDLAPLSHMALPLIGHGQVHYQGKIEDAAAVLKAEGLKPRALTYKEGLALNNGTQFMTALGLYGLFQADKLVATADLAAALTLEALCGRKDAFDKRIHAIRPHGGQQRTAAHLRSLIEGSALVNIAPAKVEGKRQLPQDSYSLRCVPQVHGASRQCFDYVASVLKIEMCAVTDNPLIFPEDDDVLSGGNFHGQPVAFALDHLKLGLATLGNISERRVAKLVDPTQNEGLPPFLTPDPGVNSGLMIPQYTAAALASENKTLAHPASVDTVPTSANTEDHVSMGPIAGRHALKIAENLEYIVAIELLSAAQGVDLRLQQLGLGLEALGTGSRRVYELIRSVVDYAPTDRDFGADMQKVAALVQSGKVAALHQIPPK